MKLQVLELPAEQVGEYLSYPYLLVISEVSEETGKKLRRDWASAYPGCRGVFVTTEKVELP